MFLRTSLVLAASVASTLGVAGPEEKLGHLVARQAEKYYHKDWSNSKADYDLTFGEDGEFSVTWDEPNGGNFVVGVGYQQWREMKLNYSGTFKPAADANAYLALYGWGYNPTHEFYVMESFGVHHPADNANQTCYGHFESDGGTYEIWMKFNGNLQQYWAVRTKRRVGGTITTGNFFDAWEAVGLPMGSKGEMVMGIEGQWGSGKADITVGVLPTTSVKESATPTKRTNVPTQAHTCTSVIDI